MSKNVLEPGSDHVLVLDSVRGTKIDDIELPDNVKQQEMVFGVVVATGPKALDTHRDDRVCYGPYAGKNVVLEGVEFRLLREGQIEAYVRTVESARRKLLEREIEFLKWLWFEIALGKPHE
jgi:co-chaperonin GroES (HSP10)